MAVLRIAIADRENNPLLNEHFGVRVVAVCEPTTKARRGRAKLVRPGEVHRVGGIAVVSARSAAEALKTMAGLPDPVVVLTAPGGLTKAQEKVVRARGSVYVPNYKGTAVLITAVNEGYTGTTVRVLDAGDVPKQPTKKNARKPTTTKPVATPDVAPEE